MQTLTIKDLLEYLDGRGLILTDDDLIQDALKDLDVLFETEIRREADNPTKRNPNDSVGRPDVKIINRNKR